MATTSQTYPSNPLIPTSTLASSTPTSSSDGDTISDLFSSNGSPPLIVAFLAIGLFVVAIVGVFAWRRLIRSRGLDSQLVRPNRGYKSNSLGEKPIVWDIWADPTLSSPIESTRWENITPVAAILSFPIPPVEPLPLPTRSADPSGRLLYRTLRSYSYAVNQLCLPEPSPPRSDEPEKEVVPPPLHTSDEIEWGDASSLQASVLITMPIRRECGSDTSEEDMDPERGALREFCIGTMDVPWSEDG